MSQIIILKKYEKFVEYGSIIDPMSNLEEKHQHGPSINFRPILCPSWTFTIHLPFPIFNTQQTQTTSTKKNNNSNHITDPSPFTPTLPHHTHLFGLEERRLSTTKKKRTKVIYIIYPSIAFPGYPPSPVQWNKIQIINLRTSFSKWR